MSPTRYKQARPVRSIQKNSTRSSREGRAVVVAAYLEVRGP